MLLVAAIKETIEDFFRHRADRSINRQRYYVIRQGQGRIARGLRWLFSCGGIRQSHEEPVEADLGTRRVRSSQIKVGDILKLRDGERVPADLVLLSSSNERGNCYITTANLDG